MSARSGSDCVRADTARRSRRPPGRCSTFGVTEPINDEPATVANGSTIAFKCDSLDQVRAWHDVAVAHGGTSIEGSPGVRNFGVGPIHLAYVRDPDGNKLCAVHRVP